jgi:phosphoglycerate dehydrogenase-like enzyme
MSTLVVAYELEANGRQIVSDAIQGAAEVIHLADLDDAGRADALRKADALLARTTRELRQGEIALLKDARLVQFINAGIDFVPLAEMPPGVPVATNGGAYAEPMAEHAMAIALAAAKRLLVEHAALARGEFNQFNRNRMLAGGVCGILGFGGIGVATARLARGLGMRVHSINRRGSSDEPTDWIGTPNRLDALLEASDVLVICTPLTPARWG